MESKSPLEIAVFKHFLVFLEKLIWILISLLFDQLGIPGVSPDSLLTNFFSQLHVRNLLNLLIFLQKKINIFLSFSLLFSIIKHIYLA